LGYGTYLSAAHGIGATPSPPAVNNEDPASLFRLEFTAGDDIPLSSNKLYLSPEIFYSSNSPTNHPPINFIPNTFSLGIRINLQWVLFEHYRQTEEKKEFIYAEGHVLDRKTSRPLAAQIIAVERQNGEIIGSQFADYTGRYEFRLVQGKDYMFIANQPGYFPDSVSLPSNSFQNNELPTILLCNRTLVRKEDSSIRVEGNVSACNREQFVQSVVRFIDPSSNLVTNEIRTDSSGNYRTNIPRAGSYIVQVDAPGYFPYDETVNLTPSDAENNIPIRMKEILVCDSVNLQSHFDFDSYNLKSDATLYVDRIAEYLRNNPAVTVSIEGHTDNIGTRSHNMLLSQNRANTLKVYLLSKGVRENQIVSVRWFGPDKPIGVNETEEGRQKNRRVDLKEVNRKDH
jgi:outer membrane protein OmpA-like peptidoglycan-associated protein